MKLKASIGMEDETVKMKSLLISEPKEIPFPLVMDKRLIP